VQPQSSRQLALIHGVKVLTYGPAGVGKTTLMATAPAPLLISAEAGLLSLRNVDVPVLPVKTLDDLTGIYNWILGSKEALQYWTIGLDSISEIGEVCLAAEKGINKDPRQAYGILIERMMLLMRSFRDLPNKHVFFSAKMEHYKDEVTGIVKYQPSMPGKQLGPAMPYMFDEVFYMGVGKDDQGKEYRYLRTCLDHQHDAKDRSGALDPIEPPDLTHIFNKILGV
jgi:hypothetical protein